MALDRTNAPFNAEQISSLKKYQTLSHHALTCKNDGETFLKVAERGLFCPDCSYAQDWAYTFMTDMSWTSPKRLTHHDPERLRCKAVMQKYQDKWMEDDNVQGVGNTVNEAGQTIIVIRVLQYQKNSFPEEIEGIPIKVEPGSEFTA